jgi:oligosaccharide 4-alpha-D-glucosyltransferase
VLNKILLFAVALLAAAPTFGDFGQYQGHRLDGEALVVSSDIGKLRITPVDDAAFEVHYIEDGIKQLPSFAIAEDRPTGIASAVSESESSIAFMIDGLTAVVKKSPLTVSFFKDGNALVAEEHGYFAYDTVRGFRFALDDGEKILGGGQRVMGMDRRGRRMPLYNKASYGYETEAEQMYYGLPAVMSSDKYLIVFDNSASGWLDIGHTEADVLKFEAVGGRTSYIVVAGESYPALIENYTDVTGKQPLPPRWAFGNYASRFGYRSEKETRDVVRMFKRQKIPLDAVILDIYWFGPDIKGHMGNLDWDRDAWPTPEKMISDFAEQGVRTIAITEPFILSTSDRWQSAVDNKVLAKTPTGSPRRFDFYFGNTGLIDVFDENAEKWFWEPYRMLFEQGTAATWGDLGEPEVHPGDALHWLSDAGIEATGDEIHNVYGHQWARMVFENQVELYPDTRPLILMRSGFAGSQRYGMVPWTGDVSRSWGGLKPQVELGLQMGLFGLAYNHSDLGGFAGGDVFDREMYIRWLQYGVFQPVYRPHAQDHIPAEPVFHDRETRDIVRDYINLRYRLLPYVYTLAYENSVTGMPLMRPLFFEDESNASLIDEKDAYLWGDAFLVAPVTDPGVNSVGVELPAGTWFDFWSGRRYDGGQRIDVPVTLETIPVLVRAGSFIPMTPEIQTTRDYSSEQLTLHYYADESVTGASGRMYEDDGKSRTSLADGAFELLDFTATQRGSSLTIGLGRSGGDYAGRPKQRTITLVVHNWHAEISTLHLGDQVVPLKRSMPQRGRAAAYDRDNATLTVRFDWDHSPVALRVNDVETEGKPVVYQVFTRLFGNKTTTNKPWGTIEENGVGKFSDFDDRALNGIRELGTTHVWYTGVPHHALIRDYTEFGISEDDPDVVKGRAGSPYAVKDYYSVNPDLADDPANRLAEFQALIERTHAHGMKVIIDIVPNHVARGYQSISKPNDVEDFGVNDDTSVQWARDNNFYYVVGEDFRVPDSPEGYAPLGGGEHQLADGLFLESPAKWTGNGSRAAQPRFDDWFETVKVNYGVRPDGSYAFDRLPDEARQWSTAQHAAFWAGREVPDSWLKFRQIVTYWLDKGVDGFRYDMAEMVPVEFWSYLNSSIKSQNAAAFLLAEVYNPDEYRNYLQLGRMDYLYDKVGFYDTLKLIMQGRASTDTLAAAHAQVQDIEQHMLHFLENHDEQRIASPGFAGDAERGRPAMVVSALISRSPTMLYFAQDVGEAGNGDAGFGDPTRTTIFDYWGVPTHQRWMNGGTFDGGGLSETEAALRDFYVRLMTFSASSKALTGHYAEIHSHNREQDNGAYNDRVFSFVRWRDDERLVVVSNFDADSGQDLELRIPGSVISAWQLKDGRYALNEQLYGRNHAQLIVDGGAGVLQIALQPLESAVLELGAPSIHRIENFPSMHVDARNVDVWVPADYHGSDKRYRVIYAHDGQNLFNPGFVWNNTEWQVDETLQHMIDEGRVDDTIVVGIWSTPKRRLEYLPQEAWDVAPNEMQVYIENQEGGSPLSREYLRFIVEELKPFIDSNYRTKHGRGDTFLLGSSMGGLISLYGVMTYPEVFGAAACLSTHWPLHVGLNNIEATEAFIAELKDAMPSPGSNRFYFDFGTEELDGRYEPHQRLIDQMMAELGYANGEDWVTRKFEGAGHSEKFWQKRLHIPLEFLLNQPQ